MAFGLAWLAAIHGAPPGGTPEIHREGGGDRALLMNWDDSLLAARIFLDPLPASMPGSEADSPEEVELGQRLYFERGISVNKSQSCHDCHLLTRRRAGVDGKPTSSGALCTLGRRNSPTVLNAGFQEAQFWDGRAVDLVDQAKGPIVNPVEMGMAGPGDVVARLQAVPGYSELFGRAFPGDPEPLTYEHAAEAIAAFERTLVAPSRFDRLLRGDEDTFSEQERRGLIEFASHNCFECHSGATIGGQLFRKIGQRRPYGNTLDLGRYEVTKREEDRFVFKVPMLRNVTRTAPYFHDGQVATLEEAIRTMGALQLGLDLPPDEVADLAAFLGTLAGDPPVAIEEPGPMDFNRNPGSSSQT